MGKVCKDKIRLPNGRIVDDYYSIELPEYVVIYAQKGDGKILFERQYKHALGSITLAVPGGCIENGELPIDAAKREFLEETGYIANKWRFVNSFIVDGNKGCGKAYFYIADGLKKFAEPIADDMEESEIVFIEPELLLKAVLNGGILMLPTAALVAIASHPYMAGENR